jgi:hypothetical protein
MLIFQAKGAGKGKEHCLESWKSLYKKQITILEKK